MQRHQQVDYGIVAAVAKPSALDLQPALGRHASDVVVVKLAVASIMKGNAAYE